MKYISTRGNYQSVSAAEAICRGMVPTGGLFVPETVPEFSGEEITEMQNSTYQQIAFKVLKEFLTDYTEGELQQAIKAAYNLQNFADPEITPLTKLTENLYILELWQGPTAAFKDLALQLMPHLLSIALKKQNISRETVILVATSGDTGKAALEGFKDVVGVKIIVFYPARGVSKIQETQMVTTGGNNTAVVGVRENFDHCQTAVKKIFADSEFNKLLEDHGYQFSSANSINWGRLVPQIVYYFFTYSRLLKRGELKAGDLINVTVPTGNFGNILAAYYAYRMGLPVNKFICASNDNNILTEFLNTGEYNTDREFKKTISPSMDILISSNLERFLFEITDHDHQQITEWYHDLNEKGKFIIDQTTARKIKEMFVGEYAEETETLAVINEVYRKYNYTMDTHTGVGMEAYYKYQKKNQEEIPAVIAATANPYKFSKAVLKALEGRVTVEDEFKILERLKVKTDLEIHSGLKDLDQKEVRHQRECGSEQLKGEIKNILGI